MRVDITVCCPVLDRTAHFYEFRKTPAKMSFLLIQQFPSEIESTIECYEYWGTTEENKVVINSHKLVHIRFGKERRNFKTKLCMLLKQVTSSIAQKHVAAF